MGFESYMRAPAHNMRDEKSHRACAAISNPKGLRAYMRAHARWRGHYAHTGARARARARPHAQECMPTCAHVRACTRMRAKGGEQ